MRTAALALGRLGMGLLALGLLATPAEATRQQFPLWGDVGDISNGIVCPKGHYMKGVRGGVGGWIVHLDVICTKDKVNPDGIVGGSSTVGYFGGSGGTDAPPVLCQHNSLIGDIRVFLTNDRRMVATLEIICYSPITFTPQGPTLVFGSGVRGPLNEEPCQHGKLVTGLRANWGKDVNAVSIFCDDFPSK